MNEIDLIYLEIFVVFSEIFDLIYIVFNRSAWLIELNFITIFFYYIQFGNLNNSVQCRVNSVLNFFVYFSSTYHVLSFSYVDFFILLNVVFLKSLLVVFMDLSSNSLRTHEHGLFQDM